MGVSEMSLINKMLQDLDARRSEVTGGGLGNHVRVVAKRSRSHTAWWVAGGLAVILAAVIAWFLLQPPRVTDTHPASPTLPVTPVPTTENREQARKTEAAPKQEVGPSAQATTKQSPPLSKGSKALEAPVEEVAKAVPDRPRQIAPEKSTSERRPQVLPKPVVPPAMAARADDDAPPHPMAPRAPKIVEPSVPPGMSKTMPYSSPQQRADNEYRKALVARQQGKTAEAIAGLEQALQLDPQLGAARQVLISMLIDGNRQDEALKRAQDALALDPAQSGMAMIASRLQLEKGQLKPAIETLERSLRYALDRPDYQAYLAALLQRDGRHKDAVDHYLVALRLQPQNGVWWMGLGISLQAENHLPEAREAFGRAKDSNALSPDLLAFVDSKLKQLPR